MSVCLSVGWRVLCSCAIDVLCHWRSLSCLLCQAINRTAELMECTNAAVDLAKVLGIQSFSMDKMLEMDPDFLVGAGCRMGTQVMVILLLMTVTFTTKTPLWSVRGSLTKSYGRTTLQCVHAILIAA